ncbi:hypothetical protein FACS1894164_10070 [Spirochaetia bacterium]|nr:hypothetical protein FACS1894164_10070 [Spirochaetia bacterium]
MTFLFTGFVVTYSFMKMKFGITQMLRIFCVILWIGLGVFVFVRYRGHTLLIDNRNVETPATRAPDMIMVSIDGGKPLEFFRGDRDRFTIAGSTHRIDIEFSDGTPDFSAPFTVGLRDDMYLLSVPKIINGIAPFIEVFHTTPEPRMPEEEIIPTDELEEIIDY